MLRLHLSICMSNYRPPNARGDAAAKQNERLKRQKQVAFCALGIVYDVVLLIVPMAASAGMLIVLPAHMARTCMIRATTTATRCPYKQAAMHVNHCHCRAVQR